MNKFKNVVLSIVVSSITFGPSSLHGTDIGCIKCHKKIEILAEKIKKTGAKDERELIDFLKNKSPKKGIHQTIKDEEIKQAFLASSKTTPTSQSETKKSNATRKKNSPKKTGNVTSTQEKSEATKALQNKETPPSSSPAPAPKKKIEGC